MHLQFGEEEEVSLAQPITQRRKLAYLTRSWGSHAFPYFALAALVSSLLVVTLGGVVRVTGSGLACPDWPLCHGRIIPPPDWKTWIEYVHRLSAATTILFTVLMAATAFGRYGLMDLPLVPSVVRRGSRGGNGLFLALLPLPLLIGQAVLGAYTVVLELPPLIALAHTAMAMAIVGSLALVVAGTPPWTLAFGSTRRHPSSEGTRAWRYRVLVLVLAVVGFLVIVSGAWVTRSGASLACLGFPLCNAPATSETMEHLQLIHMLHRVATLVVVGLTFWVVWEARKLRASTGRMFILAHVVAMVLGVQVVFGISNVLFKLPMWARAGHVALAGILFAGLMLLVGTLWRQREDFTPTLYEQLSNPPVHPYQGGSQG